MNDAIFLPTHRGDHIEKTQLEFEPREFCPEVKEHLLNPPRPCPYCNHPQDTMFSAEGLRGMMCLNCLGELVWAIRKVL